MEKKLVGRNHALSEEEVKTVIRLFKEEEMPIGVIKYSDIHRFASKLYDSNIITNSTSDSFWRKKGRLGRIEVDKANKVFSETFIISNEVEVNVPNVVDLVNKKYKNKEDLLKHLIFMEEQFHQSLQREKNLIENTLILEEKLKKQNNNRKEVEEQNNSLQGLVYKLYRVLSESNNQEVQQKTEYAMKNVFNSPISFFDFEKQNKQSSNDVIPFTKKEETKNKLSNRFRKS